MNTADALAFFGAALHHLKIADLVRCELPIDVEAAIELIDDTRTPTVRLVYACQDDQVVTCGADATCVVRRELIRVGQLSCVTQWVERSEMTLAVTGSCAIALTFSLRDGVELELAWVGSSIIEAEHRYLDPGADPTCTVVGSAHAPGITPSALVYFLDGLAREFSLKGKKYQWMSKA